MQITNRQELNPHSANPSRSSSRNATKPPSPTPDHHKTGTQTPHLASRAGSTQLQNTHCSARAAISVLRSNTLTFARSPSFGPYTRPFPPLASEPLTPCPTQNISALLKRRSMIFLRQCGCIHNYRESGASSIVGCQWRFRVLLRRLLLLLQGGVAFPGKLGVARSEGRCFVGKESDSVISMSMSQSNVSLGEAFLAAEPRAEPLLA